MKKRRMFLFEADYSDYIYYVEADKVTTALWVDYPFIITKKVNWLEWESLCQEDKEFYGNFKRYLDYEDKEYISYRDEWLLEGDINLNEDEIVYEDGYVSYYGDFKLADDSYIYNYFDGYNWVTISTEITPDLFIEEKCDIVKQCPSYKIEKIVGRLYKCSLKETKDYKRKTIYVKTSYVRGDLPYVLDLEELKEELGI